MNATGVPKPDQRLAPDDDLIQRERPQFERGLHKADYYRLLQKTRTKGT